MIAEYPSVRFWLALMAIPRPGGFGMNNESLFAALEGLRVTPLKVRFKRWLDYAKGGEVFVYCTARNLGGKKLGLPVQAAAHRQ